MHVFDADEKMLHCLVPKLTSGRGILWNNGRGVAIYTVYRHSRANPSIDTLDHHYPRSSCNHNSLALSPLALGPPIDLFSRLVRIFPTDCNWNAMSGGYFKKGIDLALSSGRHFDRSSKEGHVSESLDDEQRG